MLQLGMVCSRLSPAARAEVVLGGWSRGGTRRLGRSAATVLCWRWLGQAPEVLLQTCWRALFIGGGRTLFVGGGRLLFGRQDCSVGEFAGGGKRKPLQLLLQADFLAGALQTVFAG
jgi:hypothetical protein